MLVLGLVLLTLLNVANPEYPLFNFFLVGFSRPASIILELAAFCRWGNFKQTWLGRVYVQAMFTIYVFHPLFMNIMSVAWVYILRHAFHVEVTIENGSNVNYMSEGMSYLSFGFMYGSMVLVFWPLCFYIRKLPILNKIF